MLKKPPFPDMTKAAVGAAGFLLAAFVVFGILTATTFAQSTAALDVSGTGIQYGEYTGLSGADIRVTIANIIRIALGFLGVLALLIVLYGGFIWMTAAGDENRVTKAKGILRSGVIGLLIIVTAFGIVSFVIARLLGATGGGGGGGGSSAPAETACIGLSATCPAGALGGGVIESHFPGRNATGIARNTRIVVTFKEAIDPASLILEGENATIAVLKSASVGSNPQFNTRFSERLLSDDLEIATTEDAKTFTLIQKNCPSDCIGSISENVFYTVALRGGFDGVKTASGAAAFSGTFNGGYIWEFQASTSIDTTPPTVSFVVPGDGTRENPRNSLIQVNFSEAVDPVSVGAGIEVTESGALIPGENLIGNAYRSVEFRSEELCGTNSCGEQIFCLPGNTQITTKVAADALTATPPTGVFPPNGITDMAGNSLDGNGDGTTDGAGEDDFIFSFETNNTIDLTPPVLISRQPDILQGEIPRDLAISALFSKLMSTTSFTSDSARLVPGPSGAPTNYFVVTAHRSSVPDSPPDRTEAFIRHDLLSVNQPYAADFTSGVRDTRQNCFYPGQGPGASCTGAKAYCCNGRDSDTACGFLE